MSITVTAEPWKEMPAWQDAPNGHGQYLLFPFMYGQFEIENRQYATTSLGVLVRELRSSGGQGAAQMPGPWEIVPELYLRHLGPLEVRDGLLWAVEIDMSQGQVMGGLRVLALDPKGWSTRQSLELPPGSRTIKVDEGGCWSLQGQQQPPSAISGSPGYASLVYCGFGGEEKLRFDAKTLTTTGPAETELERIYGKTKPTPLIYWWAVDPDAAYVSVVDYRGIAPNDAPIYGGPSHFVRIDRISGKQVALVAGIDRRTPMANAPQRVLFVRPRCEDGRQLNGHVIYQLDKQAMRISQLGILRGRRIEALAADGEYLWARVLPATGEGWQTRAYSLKDFTEFSDRGAGPFEASPDRYGVSLLGGDETRIWLAGGSQIFELNDEGQSLAREMSGVFPLWDMNWPSAAGPGALYCGAGLKLFRISAGSNEVICRDRPPEDLSYPNRLNAGGRYLWAANGYDLVAFDEDLMEVRKLSTQTYQTAVAVSGNAVYYFSLANRTPTLMRGEAVTGEQTPVESWDTYARQWCMRTYGTDKPPAGLWTPGLPYWMTADNSGRLRMLYHRRTSPRKGELEASLMLWAYDVGKDEWQDQDLPKHYGVFSYSQDPGLLRDTRQQVLVKIVDGKLTPLPSLPGGRLDYHRRTHVTDKYVYTWTPLGLWRAPRVSERGGK